MALLTIDYDDRDAAAYLAGLVGRLSDLRPLMLEIGAEVQDSTQRRFATSTGPDGERWAPNTETTILMYLAGRGGVYGKKDGKLTKKGAGTVMGKKPLVAEGNLAGTIDYQLDGDSAVMIGTPTIYGGVQQFGADAGSLGGGAPWGDIPARPFLGLSDADERTILDLVGSYLEG
jgi:phage virion morphogenesis protein